ncbi:MAG: hypothetical protein JO035_07825 [Betaproteobacteria bacterium]|nr:hypothetical protein [Betaproteobacteria bacterium]
MNKSKLFLSAALLAAGSMAAGSALAWGHGPRVVFGFNFGVPYYPAPYYYYPAPVVYAPPAPVVIQQAPQVYTERPDVAAAAPAPQNMWYYCPASRGYYPYVHECPGGWQQVPATPAR